MKGDRCIGLVGPEGAGKTTVAKILEEHHGYVRLPFAAPLKEMISALGVPDRHLYGTTAEKEEPLHILGGKSARRALQTLGTEWGRMCMGEDFWVDAWRGMAASFGGGVISDDVRFLNEANAIHKLGGIIIRVMRHPSDVNRIPKHASENFSVLPYDVTIINDGSVDDLRVKIDSSISALMRYGAL